MGRNTCKICQPFSNSRSTYSAMELFRTRFQKPWQPLMGIPAHDECRICLDTSLNLKAKGTPMYCSMFAARAQHLDISS